MKTRCGCFSNALQDSGKKQQSRSSKEERFAVLLKKGEDDLSTFQQYLFDKKIGYQTELIENLHVLWDFKGDRDSVNGLRLLIGG